MDDVVTQVRELLKSNLKGAYKKYFDGDPVLIPESMLPCIIVYKDEGEHDFGPTQMDENVHRIVVQVVFNKKNELGRGGSEVGLHKKVRDALEARGSDGEYLDSSVMGVLRKNININTLTFTGFTRTNYFINPRPQDVVTEEGEVTFDVRELIVVTRS